MSDSISNAYDKLAFSYEHTVDIQNAYNTDYERPAMMRLMPGNMKSMNVLDAGCAAGWYSNQLVQMGANVTAVDISPEMVNATKRRVGDAATVLCHDLSKPLPFESESFDLIVSSLTLHYLEDWDQSFREFHRVLKPSGRLLFSVHHPFMDFKRYETGDYFGHQQLRDYWEAGNETVEVVFYRRSLQSILNQTTCYFHVENLSEPQPVPAFERKKPNSYRMLMTNPYFLIVRACKQI